MNKNIMLHSVVHIFGTLHGFFFQIYLLIPSLIASRIRLLILYQPTNLFIYS